MVGALPSPNFSGPLTPAPAPRLAQAYVPKATNTNQPQQSSATLRPPAKVAGNVPREWIPQVASRSWQSIVIHHSATPVGGASRFDRDHKDKGWDELGYDFVIGNGTDTSDGQIEVGPRWLKQKVGAHAKTPDNWYNEHGIGICLVGNFEGSRPSAAQMRSVAKLVAYMMRTYHISENQIVGHGNTKSTACPGRFLSVAEVQRMAGQMLAAQGGAVARTPRMAGSAELLVDVKGK